MSIENGFSQNKVQSILGSPHKINKGTYPKGPLWGPQEGLEKKLFPHMKYVEYIYTVKNDNFYIWFSRPSSSKNNQWSVVDKAKYPVGAIFEAVPVSNP